MKRCKYFMKYVCVVVVLLLVVVVVVVWSLNDFLIDILYVKYIFDYILYMK